MGLRTKFRIRWKLFIGCVLTMIGGPVIEWAFAGFAGFPFEQSWMTAARFAAAVIGPLQVLGGLQLFFFTYLPYKIAKKRNAGSPDLRRR
ncbi:hypothetical protein CKO24_12065 [Rhodothalassium salexigens DSM 2132]|nr:hypothetical protein [Rhodothalassium salexigens DSM 2132]